MSVIVDERKKVFLPGANPGEEFEIQAAGEGVFILKRVEPVQTTPSEARLVKENGFTVIETDGPVDEIALKEALSEFP